MRASRAGKEKAVAVVAIAKKKERKKGERRGEERRGVTVGVETAEKEGKKVGSIASERCSARAWRRGA